jgi:hypothetical protein
VDLSEPYLDGDGLWRVSVYPGHADVLLGALRTDWLFVLIETWDGQTDWHEAIVSVGTNDDPQPRLVRHHSFDLLVTPADASQIGTHLRAQGLSGGGLGAYQFRERPRSNFRLPDWSRGRADAMRGQRVELAIDLPHDEEVAVVSSPYKFNLIDYVARLK